MCNSPDASVVPLVPWFAPSDAMFTFIDGTRPCPTISARIVTA